MSARIARCLATAGSSPASSAPSLRGKRPGSIASSSSVSRGVGDAAASSSATAWSIFPATPSARSALRVAARARRNCKASSRWTSAASARSRHASLLHLCEGSSAPVASEFDALRHCRGAGGACLPSAAPVVWDETRTYVSDVEGGGVSAAAGIEVPRGGVLEGRAVVAVRVGCRRWRELTFQGS
jgi:hypothetical protein